MLIDTRDYGNVDINESDIITFKQGLYGFEQMKKFVVLGQDGEGIMQLQSVEDTSLRFIILDPYLFIDDYNPELPKQTIKELEAAERGELCVFVITVIPEDLSQMTVNLKSPVIINFEKKLGMQVILDDDYTMRYKLLQSSGGETC